MTHISEIIHNHYLTRLLNIKLKNAIIHARGGAGGSRASANFSLPAEKPPTSLKADPLKLIDWKKSKL